MIEYLPIALRNMGKTIHMLIGSEVMNRMYIVKIISFINE